MRIHFNQVHYAFEGLFFTYRQLDRDGVRAQSCSDHVYDTVEIRAHDIHFVYMAHSWNIISVSLSPDCLRLRLNAAFRAEKRHCSVENAQRSFNFHGKIDVSGSIDYIDPRIFPDRRRCSGSYSDTPFLLLDHIVHRSSSFVSLTELMSASRVKQDPLCRGGLSGIDMSHDTYVSSVFKRNIPRHIASSDFPKNLP